MSKPLEKVDKALRVPFYQVLFLKIAEPRIIRVIVFAIYVICFWAGIVVVSHRPEQFLKVIGSDLATVFGLFIVAGSFIGAIAVLPGIWWLERVGLILLFTCVTVYVVILSALNATPVAGAFVLGFALFIIARFLEIRGAQLAPKEA